MNNSTNSTNINNSNKYAVMIGIKYSGINQLDGTYNDINSYKKILIDKFGYLEKNITILMDNNININPTKKNIIENIKNLALKTNGTNFVQEVTIYYAGHGYKTYYTNDKFEKDNSDECIITVDYKHIIDNELNDLLRSINVNTKVICIFDCCHSGTISDVFFCFLYDKQVKKIIKDIGNGKEMKNKNIFILSGCKDNETSDELYINNLNSGLLSYALRKTLAVKNYKCSIKELLLGINNNIEQVYIDIPSQKYSNQNTVISVSSDSIDENTIMFDVNTTNKIQFKPVFYIKNTNKKNKIHYYEITNNYNKYIKSK